jgi:hypothetical protein
MSDVNISFAEADQRPPFILDDVINSEFRFVKAPKISEKVPTFWLFNVKNFEAYRVKGLNDVKKESVTEEKL